MSNKVKIKMRLEGFELEIEADKENISQINRNIGAQMTGLLKPAGAIAGGEFLEDNKTDFIDVEEPAVSTKKKLRRQKSVVRSSAIKAEKSEAPNWRHDSSKYSTPSQDWKTAQKSMWILYVVQEEMGISELSTTQIANAFNEQFRQAGMVKHSNVSRDLGKLKLAQNGRAALVGEQNGKWFLTGEGRKEVQTLIAQAQDQRAA